MGLVTQSMKQMFGAQRGEFLRVLYQQGTTTGYLVRALSNMILKQLQEPIYTDPMSIVGSASDTIMTLARRGLHPSMAQLLYDDIIRYWPKVRSDNDDPAPLSTPLSALITPRSSGGFGAPYPYAGNSTLPSAELPSYPKLDLTAPAGLLEGQKCHMTDDWLHYISTKMPSPFRVLEAEALRRVSLLSSYGPLIRAELRGKPARQLKSDIRDWLNVVRPMLTDVRPVPIEYDPSASRVEHARTWAEQNPIVLK